MYFQTNDLEFRTCLKIGLSIYAISSIWVYKKNNAILNAGKIIPTMGTKIDGKKAADILNFIL